MYTVKMLPCRTNHGTEEDMNLGFHYFAERKNEAKLPFEKKTIILNLLYFKSRRP